MILIRRDPLKRIVDLAEAAYPEECCGLLIGTVRRNGDLEVTQAAPSRNVSRSPGRFEIDPQLWVSASRAHSGGASRVIGLYHSHPDAPAQPSTTDLEAAWGEEMIWLIVSVVGDGKGPGQAVHVTTHVLDHGGRQFRQLDLRTSDWRPYPTQDLPDTPRGME